MADEREVAIDEAIARIVRPQRGRITTEQLLALGLTPWQIGRRAKAGRLIREHHGVYAVAHLAPIPLAKEHAVLLACEDAVLARASSLGVWQLGRPPKVVEIVVPPGRPVRRAGVRAQRTRLEGHEIRVVEGLRVTTVARTLADLAGELSLDALDRLVAEAHATGRLRLPDLEPYAARRAGAEAIRTVLGAARSGMTKSELERRFLRLVARAGLPRPETGRRWGSFELDALWPEQRLVVELDGFTTHGHRRRFETDRTKDVHLRAAGFDVRRATATMVEHRPELVVADVVRGLERPLHFVK